jgi:hypothetical protein
MLSGVGLSGDAALTGEACEERLGEAVLGDNSDVFVIPNRTRGGSGDRCGELAIRGLPTDGVGGETMMASGWPPVSSGQDTRLIWLASGLSWLPIEGSSSIPTADVLGSELPLLLLVRLVLAAVVGGTFFFANIARGGLLSIEAALSEPNGLVTVFDFDVTVPLGDADVGKLDCWPTVFAVAVFLGDADAVRLA